MSLGLILALGFPCQIISRWTQNHYLRTSWLACLECWCLQEQVQSFVFWSLYSPPTIYFFSWLFYLQSFCNLDFFQARRLLAGQVELLRTESDGRWSKLKNWWGEVPWGAKTCRVVRFFIFGLLISGMLCRCLFLGYLFLVAYFWGAYFLGVYFCYNFF